MEDHKSFVQCNDFSCSFKACFHIFENMHNRKIGVHVIDYLILLLNDGVAVAKKKQI